MVLVAGATGLLGGDICRRLAAAGRPVRGLVRSTSDPQKVARLKESGAEVMTGDLKDRASLDRACRGADAVISTASSTLSRQAGDSIGTVDLGGQRNLIDAAAAAGVKRFVLVSFPPIEPDCPLQEAKRAAEQHLMRSGLTYIILQPTLFTEVWLGPTLGLDLAKGTAQIYGSGDRPISWISYQDVARFAVGALDSTKAANTTVQLGGPEALSPLDVVRAAEGLTGRALTVVHVPEEALRAQYESATDPLQKSFAALMLSYASGGAVDTRPALERIPLEGLKPAREVLAGWV